MPFFFKSIVDALNVEIDPTTGQGAFAIAGTVIVGCAYFPLSYSKLAILTGEIISTLRPQTVSPGSAPASFPNSATPSLRASRRARSAASLVPCLLTCSASISGST